MLSVEFPCCASNLLLVHITDESTPYSGEESHAGSINDDLGIYNEAVNCTGAKNNKLAIFQVWSESEESETFIWFGGFDNIKANFDLPEDLVFEQAAIEPEEPYRRFDPSDLIDVVSSLLDDQFFDRVIYVVDNSGSISLADVQEELLFVVRSIFDSYEIKQTITSGGESYFADFARTLENKAGGDWLRAVN